MNDCVQNEVSPQNSPINGFVIFPDVEMGKFEIKNYFITSVTK